MTAEVMRIGTRKSAMALAQTEEIARRLDALPPFAPRTTSRWLRRYARMVTSASTGAVFADF